MMQKRLSLLSVLAILVALGIALAATLVHARAPVVEVYKSAYCGCCELWVEHLRANGFTVNAHNVSDPAAHRARLGIPAELGSCHSATVGDYVIEGHVPASDIQRLLAEKPKARGLAVPGMPLGSPGMEAERSDPYDVMLIADDGRHSVYRHYAADGAARTVVAASMAEGEVRKIDTGKGRVTIKHGPLANLGMPPMTMAFEAEPQVLASLKPGDRVRFAAEKSGNGYRVSQIEVQR